MVIAHQKVVDEKGQPEAALVPWEVFVKIQKLLESGDIPNAETIEAINEPLEGLPRFKSVDALIEELGRD